MASTPSLQPVGLTVEEKTSILSQLCHAELPMTAHAPPCPLRVEGALDLEALSTAGSEYARRPVPPAVSDGPGVAVDPSSFDFLLALARGGDSPFCRCLESPLQSTSVVEGRRVVMLGANNYLGLTTHPEVVARTMEAVMRYGTGCTGSRLMNGTLPLHRELEERLAAFFGGEAALVFSAGFLANVGVLSTLGTRDTTFLTDHDNHASITEGILASFARSVRFRHNDPDALRERLRKLPARSRKWVILEGVHSMLGDVCPLPDLLAVARESGARVMLDDAHGVGVLGDGGRGTANHYGLDGEVDILVGTFSKSFASYGGFVVARREIIDDLRFRARAYIFTAALPPANAATVLAALDILEREPAIVERLRSNTSAMCHHLMEAGILAHPSDAAIIPIEIGTQEDTWNAWKTLFELGVYTNAVFPPAVPAGRSMLRLSMMASLPAEVIEPTARTIAATVGNPGVTG